MKHRVSSCRTWPVSHVQPGSWSSADPTISHSKKAIVRSGCQLLIQPSTSDLIQKQKIHFIQTGTRQDFHKKGQQVFMENGCYSYFYIKYENKCRTVKINFSLLFKNVLKLLTVVFNWLQNTLNLILTTLHLLHQQMRPSEKRLAILFSFS